MRSDRPDAGPTDDGSTLTMRTTTAWIEELPGLIERALTGDEQAWRNLVDRFSGLVWKVLSTYDLSASDREEAFASPRLGTVFPVVSRNYARSCSTSRRSVPSPSAT